MVEEGMLGMDQDTSLYRAGGIQVGNDVHLMF